MLPFLINVIFFLSLFSSFFPSKNWWLWKECAARETQLSKNVTTTKPAVMNVYTLYQYTTDYLEYIGYMSTTFLCCVDSLSITQTGSQVTRPSAQGNRQVTQLYMQCLQKWRIFAKVATFHPSVAPKKVSGEISPNPIKVATFCNFQKKSERSRKMQIFQ